MSYENSNEMADRHDPPQMIDTGWFRAHQKPIRIVAASNVAMMLVGLLFMFQSWRMGSMLSFWALASALVLAALNLAFLYRTRNIKLAGYVSTSVLFVLLLIMATESGGFYDPMFAWLYVVPLAAAFLVDLTALIVFVGLVLAATVAFWFLPAGALPTIVPPDMYPLHSLFNRLAALLSLGMMTAFFVRAQHRALGLLKQANEALRREVDAHTRTTEALAESEAEFRDLVENSADMIWTHDLAGTILSANEPFTRFLGLASAKVVGKAADGFLAPRFLTHWKEYLRKVADDGTYRGMMEWVDGGGRVRTLELHNTVRKGGTEPPLVRVLARDVTRQVAAQASLQRRVDQEQLMVAISTRFIDTGAEELASGIELALGEIGLFLGCDRLSFFLVQAPGDAFERLARWSSAEPNAGTEPSLPASIPWLQPRLEQFETIAVTRPDDLPSEGQADLEALLGSGIRSATIVPVFGKEGLMGLLTLETLKAERTWRRDHQALAHIAGMVFGNAITRARDEDRTLRLKDEIQQARKMESLGLIAGGIAHDFNNLLMVVLGNASLAMSQVPEGSGAQEALQAIDSSARSAAKLTAQMLAYAGGAAMDRGDADLNELVSIELEQVRGGTKPGIEVRLTPAVDLPSVFADSSLLRQMLRALLDNALEALEESGGTVNVVTRSVDFDASAQARGYRPIRTALPSGACAVLEVRDSGGGIEPDVIEKIFDPFFSTKFAGRGLGLAAALGVVKGHEGLIEVESGSDGTRMRVFVPFAKSDESLRSSATAGAENSNRPDELDGLQPAVLLLDSNPEVQAVLDGLLTSRGYMTVKVDQTAEALAHLDGSAQRLRAVVADLKSVEESDSLLAARWRTEDIPWIFSSDERQEDISERLAYAGASAFLSKPFEGRKLLSLLEGLLREYASARSAR